MKKKHIGESFIQCLMDYIILVQLYKFRDVVSFTSILPRFKTRRIRKQGARFA